MLAANAYSESTGHFSLIAWYWSGLESNILPQSYLVWELFFEAVFCRF
jgi:hypothetical protein